MRTVIVPRYATRSGIPTTDLLRSIVVSSMIDFCSRTLQELKLVASTYTYEFNIRNSRERTFKQSMVKLSRIFERAAIKENPTLLNVMRPCDGPLLQPSTSGSVSLQAYTPRTEPGTSEVSFARYVRYCQYLAIKNKVPLSLVFSERPCTADEPHWVSVTAEIAVALPVELGVSVTRTAYEEWVRGKLEQGVSQDSLYNKVKIPYAFYSVEHVINAMLLTANPYFEPCIPEKIFLHIPSILKSIQTISRKLSYATDVYLGGDEEVS